MKRDTPVVILCGGQGTRIREVSDRLPKAMVEIGGESVPMLRAYGEAARGELLALVSSDDRVEVAVREGSAAARLRVGRGAPVRLVAL